MKTFESFNDNEKEIEDFFLEIAHLDELEIRFDFIKYDIDLFYYYDGLWLFDKDKIHKDMYLSYENIWSKFKKNFEPDSIDFYKIITKIVNKHFNLTDYGVSNLSIVNW